MRAGGNKSPMKRRASALEIELRAAAAPPPERAPAPFRGEAMAMLLRRGLRPERSTADVPFDQPLDAAVEEAFAARLGHYAFRLFLRGAIRQPDGFRPADTTRYVAGEQAAGYAAALVGLGLAERMARGRFRLKRAARNFGGTLEWYVGRELECRYGFDVATGVKLHVRGGGGDLDVVAAAEGKLVYVELKSSPPKNLDAVAMEAFGGRLRLLRPDVAVFAVDTALRLSDKVVPMLLEELRRGGGAPGRPERFGAQIWALTPHVYAVNGSRDLMANVMKAIGAGFRALSPE